MCFDFYIELFIEIFFFHFNNIIIVDRWMFLSEPRIERITNSATFRQGKIVTIEVI